MSGHTLTFARAVVARAVVGASNGGGGGEDKLDYPLLFISRYRWRAFSDYSETFRSVSRHAMSQNTQVLFELIDRYAIPFYIHILLVSQWRV